MRSLFQIAVFIGYLAALGWGGWYVFSGQMIADREAAEAAEALVPSEPVDPAPSEPDENEEPGTAPEEADPAHPDNAPDNAPAGDPA